MAVRAGLAGLLMLGAITAARASASGSAQLEHFFATVSTFQADFHQIVHDDNGQVLEDSQGEVWIKRPGRFRWNYRTPLQQEIVSDGKRVWIYDIDLEQVTVRDVDTTLGRTPALLLAGGGDIRRSYRIAHLPPRDGLARVALTPIASDTTFSRLNIGLQDGKLAHIELVDALGQTTEITFSRPRVNQPIDDALFAFKPPPGADVIDDSTP